VTNSGKSELILCSSL